MALRIGGFSLLELVVATMLTTIVVAGVFAVMHPAQGAFVVGPERADVQQRLRVAIDTLTRDLSAAGAGAYIAGRRGSLIRTFAPMLPFRWGLSGAVQADTITVVSVPATAAQTTLAADLLPGVLTLQAAVEPGCPVGTNLCGFTAGATIAVYDDAGSVGVFAVAAVADAAAQVVLASRSADASATYRAGSTVVEVRMDTYFLKSDAAAQTFQLMHADGVSGADVPVVDHVVGLAFEYDVDPAAPILTDGEASYGPAPPPIGTQTTAYPPGENCAFRVDPDSGEQVARLPPLSAAAALVPMTPAQLADGPWCPDEASATRWDADLLRIRRVGVTIRVEAAAAALRGPVGNLFAHPGTAGGARRWVPDQELRFHVSPRNMNLEHHP